MTLTLDLNNMFLEDLNHPRSTQLQVKCVLSKNKPILNDIYVLRERYKLQNLILCLNWEGREGEWSRVGQKLGIISNSSHLLCRTYTYNFCYIHIHGSEDYIIHVITSFYKPGYVDPLTNLNSYCHFSDMSTKRPRYTKHISA